VRARRLLPALVLCFAAGSLAACWDAPALYEGFPDHVRRRHVALDGAHNFRDLGGYQSEDGRSVRWGTFYRSDNLHELSDADLEVVADLGVRLVGDFRGPEEWQSEPDRLPQVDPPRVAHLEIWDESFSSAGVREMIGNDEIPDLGQLLVEGNRMFATRFADRYAALFEEIAQAENLPVLVHCTAGKDRAGFASALILRTLGVPMETVYEDFLLTNHYTAERVERRLYFAELASGFRLDGERLRPLLGVERRFLEAGFAAIEEEHGDFDSFRREALGISDEQLVAFRELGLE
jgi:protein-tyrosine phosphatase